MTARRFPGGAGVAQVRIARPTDRLEEVVRFYRDGLGLVELGRFEGHAGFDGVMLGLPDASVHLEFTRHEGGSPGPAPSRDNLLVLYVPDAGELAAWRDHMIAAGHEPVAAENPYWDLRGVTFEDPDGWRIVLHGTAGI
ncbi:VOC family protein [Nocardioides sp.]|uniref:VOC family protein n=1 Tax=Nocardioides sp. TaxID=35761 RepID=UPI0035643DD1